MQKYMIAIFYLFLQYYGSLSCQGEHAESIRSSYLYTGMYSEIFRVGEILLWGGGHIKQLLFILNNKVIIITYEKFFGGKNMFPQGYPSFFFTFFPFYFFPPLFLVFVISSMWPSNFLSVTSIWISFQRIIFPYYIQYMIYI